MIVFKVLPGRVVNQQTGIVCADIQQSVCLLYTSYLLSADRTESPSHTGVEQAQVFVDFGRSAYGGTGIAAAYFLLDGNGRGDTLDAVSYTHL